MIKRSIRFAPLTLVLLLGASAHAKGGPDVDANTRGPAAANNPVASVTAAGFVASIDSQRGVPTFFWADPSLPSPAASLLTAGPEALAKAYVEQNAKLYGLSPTALRAAYVRNVHDTGRGGIIVTFGQRVDGIELFDNEMKVLLDRKGALVAIGGNLHAAASPKGKGTKQAFTAGPARAIAGAVGDAYEVPLKESDLTDLKKEKGGYRYFGLLQTPTVVGKDLAFGTPARAKKVFYPMPSRLVAAYYLEVDGSLGGDDSDMWGYVISADSGEILVRRHLQQDAAFKYRVWADQSAPYTPASGPQADFSPHPVGIPNNSSPPFVAPTLVSMEGFNTNPNGMADPWLDAAATETVGNNVDAYADLAAPDGFDPATDVRATLIGPLSFDRTYDVTLTPAASTDQVKASVADIFYVTNWLHDYWYDSGFDESAGNAQASNFGRGGVEGDSMKVEAQDYLSKDNANMNTPSDGERPRMQMFLWNGKPESSLSVAELPGISARKAASFGDTMYDITAELVLADDGIAPTTDACTAIMNNVTGKIVLLDRGVCTFESKVLRAQQAGAVGVLLANNSIAGLPGMADDAATTGVTIASLGILQADGNTLKAVLAAGTKLTVTMAQSGVKEVDRDGTIDGDIVAHEWGHYLHHRLVNCGGAVCGGQSEGWGDFNALLMRIHEDDDVATGTFGLSIYTTAALGDAGYFGIRRFPYTRDLNKNGLTFKHQSNGVVLPVQPQQSGGATNFEVHNVGEIWASMLFQGYTSLLMNGGHPFDEAKRRMADYLVAGMMMAPVNPTMTEQRDGILAAAHAADPADYALLAQGFADRGAGTCAVAPIRTSTTGAGVVEDFMISGVATLISATLDDSVKTCDGDGYLDAQEIGKLKIQVRNSGSALLAGTKATISTAAPGVTFPSGTEVTLPDIAAFNAGTAEIEIALDASVTAITDVEFTLTLDNAASCNPSVMESASFRVHLDDAANASKTETADSDKAPWVKWGADGFEDLADVVWSRDREANGNFRFYGQNFTSHSDTAIESPDFVVGAVDPLVITFAHAYDFEVGPAVANGPSVNWDGGMVELSDDGGATWTDVSTLTAVTYPGVIVNIVGADNPLADRPAFVGRNPAWPATNNVTLDFGTAFAGETVKLRFRIGSDAGAGVPDFLGWYVDNITATGITNQPFRTVSADAAGCNLAPVAVAGPDQEVDENTLATLDASASSDPDGDVLTYEWVQTAGPDVTLSSASDAHPSFTAPEVAVDTTLTFELTADDGIHTVTDSVNVLVKDVPVITTGSGGSGGTGGSGGSGGTGTTTTGSGASGGTGGNGGNGGAGGTTTTTTDTTTTTPTDTTSDGGGGAGGAGTGGNGITPAGGCDCDVASSTQSMPGSGSLFAPLLGALAFLIRRKRKSSDN